jgi:hypothetical protein
VLKDWLPASKTATRAVLREMYDMNKRLGDIAETLRMIRKSVER